MLDSVDPAAVITAIKDGKTWRNMQIRAGAGYLDGAQSVWPPQAFKDLAATGAEVVTITVLGAPGAHVADCEKGDLGPAGAARWAAGEHRAGRTGTVYCNRSNKPAIINIAGGTYGLRLGTDYHLGVATLDGTFADVDGTDLRHQPGVVYIQYLGAAAAGIDADASVLVGDWPAATPAARALTAARELDAVLHGAYRQSGAVVDLVKALR